MFDNDKAAKLIAECRRARAEGYETTANWCQATLNCLVETAEQLEAAYKQTEYWRAEFDELRETAKRVVLERASKIGHARESSAMCKLHRLITKNCDTVIDTATKEPK